MQNRREKSSLLIAGLVLICFLVFGASVVGGAVGYRLAENWNGNAPVAAVAPGAAVIPQPASASTEAGTVQSLTITEQSASVDAVGQVLPAVVTVLIRSRFGAGSGTGFFISNEGYVVTNNHVVENASEISIVYATGGQVPARLVGTAPEFDVAVLQVDGPVPAIAEWGDSSELPLGAGVVAIGSALGEYRNTVTSGVLSGFNRQLAGMSGLLQTDAAINQGNSGGPLINLGGQVIGINTLVARGGGEIQGVNFAIPSNTARNVVRNLIETGEARQPFLGIQYQPLNPQLATELGIDLIEGAALDNVLDGTPAARAGLQPGDVITAINGKAVTDREPLVSLLLEHVAGDTITLDVWRNGQTIQTELTLGERA